MSPYLHTKNGLVHQVQILGLGGSKHVTLHINNTSSYWIPIPMASLAHGMMDLCTWYVAISFRSDDAIILQLDWTFIVLGHRAKYLNLVHQFFMCGYGLGTRLGVFLLIILYQ